MPKLLRRTLLAAILLCAPSAVWAVPPGDDEPAQIGTVLTGYTVQAGMYRVHRKGHQAYLEVPAALLDRSFLLATSVAGGPDYTGFQWSDTVCAWQRLDRRLLLVEREVRYLVRDQRRPVQEVVRRTYTDRVLAALPIACLAGQNPVIDLNALFAGQASEFFGGLGAGLDAGICMIDSIKCFPENVELALTMPDRRRAGRLTTIAYSLSSLPDPKVDRYPPRLADDRVGYFLTAVKDYTDDGAAGDRFVRYVNRWWLEKADPALERSPVRNPIIFYVERTVPFRFRQAVAEGILEWNRAFEQCGLVGAVVVRQQTETEFADLDPEDVRYNFFRWIVSDVPFAMGPSRVNPYTGQILDADIVMDESMVRSYLRDYEVTIREAPRAMFSPRMNRLLDEEQDRYPFARRDAAAGTGADTTALSTHRRETCSLGEGLAHQLSFGLLAADLVRTPRAGGPETFPDEFMAQIVKDVVMHEVGHTLGLRHNFKASTWRSMGEINSAASPGDITGSVMDYNPINVSPGGDVPQGNYTMRTIGPYDFWAIRYGYATFPNEAEGLRATVAAVTSPQYTYGTDEDTWSPDPRAMRWDLGADPLEYARGRMTLARDLWGQAVDRVVAEGEDYRDARSAFDMLLFDYGYAGLIASRYVGGQYVHRDHRGDPGARDPLVPIPAETQRAALDFVCERILASGNFEVPPAVLRMLGKGNHTHWGSDDWMAPHSYPYYDRVLRVQRWVLFSVMNPETLSNLVDAEVKAAPDQDLVTVPEVFERLSRTIFGHLIDPMGTMPADAATARRPLVSTIDRNLQRAFVSELVAMLVEDEDGWTPPVVRNQARLTAASLVELLADRAGQLEAVLDPYTRAHLQEVTARLERALEATYQIGGGGGDVSIMLMVVGEDGSVRPARQDELPPELRLPPGLGRIQQR